ncbi:MAG: purine-nucleoside phosphorylase [Pseudomonadota bacterium]
MTALTEGQIASPLAARVATAHASAGDAFTGASIGLILGSGLDGLADDIAVEHSVETSAITGLRPSTAPSHRGRLVRGMLFGQPVLALQGRVHLYEGYSALDVAMPVYLMAALGVETLIITNAAGGLNPDYQPGNVVLIRDHLNMTGHNPLAGVDAPEIGLRFPDMSCAYDPALRSTLMDAANRAGHPLTEGIYAGVTGPSLETSAERRMLRTLGGDLVGMSTVMEVIAANHARLKVAGLSVVTNAATGGPDQQPDTLEDVLENAAKGARGIREVLKHGLPILAGDRRRD